jgi:hypothetical protein
MTLYLIKWSDGSTALIHAEDEAHLSLLLDEVADPAAASWQVYEGPLWLELPKIDCGPGSADVDPLDLGMSKAEVSGTGWGYEFEEELLRLLHPTVAALRARTEADQTIPRAEAASAIEADLDFGLAGSILGGPTGLPQ